MPDTIVDGFTFVTDSIESALAKAKEAAGDKDVWIMGGATVARQYLKAGLVDELHLHIVPLLLDDGIRLWGDIGTEIKLEHAGLVQTLGATHIRYRVVKGEIIVSKNNDTQPSQQSPKPGPEHKLLDVFIGKWINEGHTIASEDAPELKILTSDVYEWMPGGFFVLHTAYGRIGATDVGGTEIIGYDAASKKYQSYFFDHQGNVSIDEFTIQGDTCSWTGERTRTTAVFTDNGKTQTAHHERLDESGKWVPSMLVTLTRVE